MGKLRWTLLILGGLFLVALALWERLRPRQARPRERRGLEPRATGLPVVDAPAAWPPRAEIRTTPAGATRAGLREPWIGEPGLDEAVPPESALYDLVARPPAADAGELSHEPPGSVIAPLEDPPRVIIDEAVRAGADEGTDESPTAELPVLSEAAVDVPAQPPGAGSHAAHRATEPIVEWPPESSRQIMALRLVAPAERFPGRALRLALAAEGFLLGKFDIFHRPDEAQRAVVSAASLTRPGTFDLETMDSQHYAGLNLFVVLPGPRPGPQALDELVDVAQNLCERLQGELQDARGEALTGESIETLRAALPMSAGGGAAS